MADEWPDDPVRVMNLCFAAARLRDRARFETNARLLVSIQRQAPTARVQAWIEHDLRDLATQADLSGPWLDELMAKADRLPGGGNGHRK